MSHRVRASGLLFALLVIGCGGGGGSGAKGGAGGAKGGAGGAAGGAGGAAGGAGGAAGAGGSTAGVCTPGATQVCVGPGACAGGQSCLANGSGWSPCDCGGSAGTSGTAGTTGAAGTSGSAGTTGGGGTTGAAGTTGSAGTTGRGGTTGTAGTTGAAGTTATAGTTGAAGTVGTAGTTGAAGTSAAGTTGTAGTTGIAGTTGAAGTTGGGPCGALIDDMEAGTGRICQGNGRNGSWFSYHDGNSLLWPPETPPLPSVLSPPRGSSQRALRTYGTFVQYAGVACFLTAVPVTYNATAYSGVQFYAKGTASALKLIVQTASTESTTYGGRCTLPTLSCAGNEAPVGSLSATDWRLVQIPFSSLANGTAAFDRGEIWSIEFQPGAGAFDFWIDDLSFY